MGEGIKTVCVLVREHRQPDGGAVQNLLHPISQLPSRDRGSTRTCCHTLPPPSAPPDPLPNPSHLLCPASVSHTSGILPSSQEREEEVEECGGGRVGSSSRAVSGGRQDEAEEDWGGKHAGGGRARSSEALRSCLPGSSPLRGSLSREPCPKSLAPGGWRSIVKRWPLQAGPPAATAAASWPLPLLPLHSTFRTVTTLPVAGMWWWWGWPGGGAGGVGYGGPQH